MKAALLKPLSEAAFTRQVLELARLRGWRTFHVRPARTRKGWRTPVQGDGTGFPDLVLVRYKTEELLFVELKAEKGKMRVEQLHWTVDLRLAGQRVYVWRPSDWPQIEEVLE